MGNFNSIKASTQRLSQLLQGELSKISGLPAFTLTLASPAEIVNPTGGNILSAYLYRVEVDPQLRNVPDVTGRREIHPLALDLHFLFTPFATLADDGLTLLNATMEVLQENPIIQIEDLSSARTLSIYFDPLTPEQMAQLWISLGTAYRLSTTYIARLR